MKTAEELGLQKLENGIVAVQGFRTTGVSCGLKDGGYKDIGLLYSERPCLTAMALTDNQIKAHPVLLDMERKNNLISAIIVNSGCANCLNGPQGDQDALEMVELTEQHLGLKKGSVLVASTGAIGYPLHMQRVRYGIEKLCNNISYENENRNFAAAIMTTDTRTKTLAFSREIGGRKVSLGMTCKGSGMIKPEMTVLHATMLVFITTDVKISREMLESALEESMELSFNRISVDNDTSTNDSVFLMANGLAGNREISEKNEDYRAFTEMLSYTCQEMAKLVVRDGEGANKLITVHVKGAKTPQEARKACRTIADSYLVKTAIFGNSPNWGRIMAALGYSGVKFQLEKIKLFINQHLVYEQEKVNTAELSAAVSEMIANELEITLELGAGSKEYYVWTCDLSYDYVKINAHYIS